MLIIGLGNPGDKFINTRHNIGRETADTIRRHFGMPDWRIEKKWNALVSEGKIGKTKIAIILPETFMNKSGNAAGPAYRFFKMKKQETILIHDDADIVFGSVKLSFAKRSAGHKGVESVIRALKTDEFWRLRIGIQRKKRVPAEKLVLQKLKPDEQKILKKMQKKIVEGIEVFTEEMPEKSVGIINQS